MRTLILSACSIVLVGCSAFSAFNKKANVSTPGTALPTLDIHPNNTRGEKDHLVILALSGGGSRAAKFASEIMLNLEKMEIPIRNTKSNILSEVDVISSVSGGSLPAAYYAISYDNPPTNNDRKWDNETVDELMTKSYRTRGLLNLLWPSNFIGYTFTSFDRTDVLAKTFEDNLFDNRITGEPYVFSDITKSRPGLNLVLNSTIDSSETNDNYIRACNHIKFDLSKLSDSNIFCKGNVFTFTNSDFNKISSDLSSYNIARAVMASATFPALLDDTSLYNFHRNNSPKQHYLHLIDGGVSDNLGLQSVIKLLDLSDSRYKTITVISVDAETDDSAWDDLEYNPRYAQGYLLVNPNVLYTISSIMGNAKNHIKSLLDLKIAKLNGQGKKASFCKLSFDQLAKNPDTRNLYKSINEIPTDFNIDTCNHGDKCAASELELAASKVTELESTCLYDAFKSTPN